MTSPLTQIRSAFVEALAAAPKVAEEVRQGAANEAQGKANTGRDAWTFQEWAEKDLKGLQGLMASAPDKFTTLYEAHYGKKPELPKA